MSHEVIAIAADHAGFALKELLKREALSLGHEVIDCGTDSTNSVDYPDFAYAAAKAVADKRATRAVLVCGSGIGMSIAANRLPAVRCALCHDENGARLARQHNDANALALGARVVDEVTAKSCLHAFLGTPFEGGRHGARVEKLGKGC